MLTQNDNWWLSEFSPTDDVDYLSRDGKTAIEVNRASHGSRGLRSAVMGMAIFLESSPSVERACLVLIRTRMSEERIRDEWEASKSVLQPPIARRLAIVVIENSGSWANPEEPFLRKIAEHFERNSISSDQADIATLPQPPGQKAYEVLKVLLNRWLRKQGPIAIGELAEEVGCSYPTVRKAIDKSTLQTTLKVTSNRSVEFKSFPHDSWRELLALSITMRKSLRFRDRSGEKPAPQALLRRLEKAKLKHIALGGVESARYWHPDFDLHGIPRIDLEYHAPHGRVDLDFVRRLDPALTRVNDPSESAVLVIHPIVRAVPSFVEQPGNDIPWADPVETALDLSDLSLTVQASQLLTYLRPEARLA